MSAAAPAADPLDVAIAAGLTGLLREFNLAGVITAADAHVAARLGELAGESDERVRLAAALAVRGPRLGHVFTDLATIRRTAAVEREDADVDLDALPWPEPEQWARAVAASRLVTGGADPGAATPLRLLGASRLYLDRYWREETQVADDVQGLALAPEPAVSLPLLGDGLRRLFGDELAGRQALAAASAVLRRLAIVAGGPGTGKTTTVARIAALLIEQASAAGASPLIALAAPTGKAAARLAEAVHAAAPQLDVAPAVSDALLALPATTIHRLLGWRPGSASRFRHDRAQRLPHDVVIVDETSMVSLTLMARLTEAIRLDARLILVGDPDQLASVEAGAVLGDLVGPARGRLLLSAGARERLGALLGTPIEAASPPATAAAVADGIVLLDRVHRFGGAIAALAEAIRQGDADAVIGRLRGEDPALDWIEIEHASDGSGGEAAGHTHDAQLAPVRQAALDAAHRVIGAARAGDAQGALAALGGFRVLCAHRRGPFGATSWNARIEAWLGDAITPLDPWYAGRPLLVTQNDHELGLYNGDTGVVVSEGESVVAAFGRGGELMQRAPSRLGSVETVFAMTIHKSQGSQFRTAAVLLPEPGSRLLTRELLYTAATRAVERLIIAGSEQAVRAAVAQPIARASGLRERLWG